MPEKNNSERGFGEIAEGVGESHVTTYQEFKDRILREENYQNAIFFGLRDFDSIMSTRGVNLSWIDDYNHFMQFFTLALSNGIMKGVGGEEGERDYQEILRLNKELMEIGPALREVIEARGGGEPTEEEKSPIRQKLKELDEVIKSYNMRLV